jgi:flagellar biosynthesis GTPase FlhF
MNRIRGRKKQICFVRLFHDDAYFISDDEGTEWEGLSNSLTKNLRQNGEISDVALAQDGSWVVVRETRFSASTGVSSSLTQRLANFYSQHSQRVRQAREEQERFARQQEEAAAAEREREAALAREAEAAAAAAAEREREIAAREAEAAAERERERATALERLRRKAEQEGRILSEVLDGQQEIQVLEGVIRRRKRDLQEALDSLPQAQRARVEANSGWNLHESPNTDRAPSACRPECVICHDAEAERALVPCGHHCFCDECALQLMRTTRSCPLCRVAATSSLRIFSQRP